MIAIFDNGECWDEHGIEFFDIGELSAEAATCAFRLVNFEGHLLATTEALHWFNGGATEAFLPAIERDLPRVDQVSSTFRDRLGAMPTPLLVALTERLKERGRPQDEDDALANEIVKEAAWRTRSANRKRRA